MTEPYTENATEPYVPPVQFNAALLLEDAAVRGWSDAELARRADVSGMAVSRLRRRGTSRAATISKLAAAIGYPVRRYIVNAAEAA